MSYARGLLRRFQGRRLLRRFARLLVRGGKVVKTAGGKLVGSSLIAAQALSIGGNLPAQADYVRDEVFVNLLHNCRAFAASGDPYSYTSVTCDANGWPTTAFTLVIPMTLDSVGTQDFNFGCTGDASDATIGGGVGWTWASGPTFSAGRTTGALRAPNGAHGQPTLAFARGVQDIEINRPGYAANGTAPLIHTAWIDWAKTTFAWVRSMDWEAINHDVSTTSFASETTMTTRHVSSQGKFHVGFAAQVAADMGNKGLWSCVKAMATDQYITDKGTWQRDNIAAAIEQAFEVGNEDWNDTFRQFYAILNAVCVEVDGWHGHNSFAGDWLDRRIVSIVSTSNVLTVTTNGNHGYTAGVTSVSVLSVGNLSGAQTVQATPTSTTFTLNDTGSNSGDIKNGGSSIVRLLNTDLNVWDGAYDMLAELHPRWIGRRACQMSDLLRAVFGDSAMMTRCNPVLMVQVGNDATQHIAYVTNRMPHPLSYYVRAIGNGKYVFFNSNESPQDGITPVDLRNVNTYNGNTPPSIADYHGCLTDAVRGAKIGNVSDMLAFNARLQNVEIWKYEIGLDANSVPLGTTNTTTNHQKLSALFDSGIKAIVKDFLREQSRMGVKRVGWYTAGAIDPAYTGEEQGWPLIDNLSNAATSARVLAIQEVTAEAPVAMARNLVAAVGTTVIDGRARAEKYPTDWPANTTYTGSATDWTGFPDDPKYLITFESTQSKTLTVKTVCTGAARSFYVYWNGAQVGSLISPTNGATETWPVTVSGTQGANSLELRSNGFVGAFIAIDNANGLVFSA